MSTDSGLGESVNFTSGSSTTGTGGDVTIAGGAAELASGGGVSITSGFPTSGASAAAVIASVYRRSDRLERPGLQQVRCELAGDIRPIVTAGTATAGAGGEMTLTLGSAESLYVGGAIKVVGGSSDVSTRWRRVHHNRLLAAPPPAQSPPPPDGT